MQNKTEADKATEQKVVHKNIYEALVVARRNMGKVVKRAEGQVGSRTYLYAKHTDVCKAIEEALLDEDCFFYDYYGFDKEAGVMMAHCSIVHAPSGTSISSSAPIPMSGDPQVVGKWQTYLKRYLLKGLTGRPDEDDDDGASISNNAQGKTPKKGKEGDHETTIQSVVIGRQTDQWTQYVITTPVGEFVTYDKAIATALRNFAGTGKVVKISNVKNRNGNCSVKAYAEV